MRTLHQIYEPYNFSSTRCHVMILRITSGDYCRIEYKLPRYVKNIKGIYVTVKLKTSIHKVAGIISLNFNGQSLKCFHSPIYRTSMLQDHSKPYQFDEQLKLNSFMQGYFKARDIAEEDYPFTVSVYLHYKP